MFIVASEQDNEYQLTNEMNKVHKNEVKDRHTQI